MNRDPRLSTNEAIAIIGMGSIFPKATGTDPFWSNIVNKVYAIGDVPQSRWNAHLYYDPDKSAPDKTYSKIGGFTEDIDTTIISRKYKIPPMTVEAMDRAQSYAILATGEAFEDSGYDRKAFDRDRTAVIIGNAIGGDKKDMTNMRIFTPFISDVLKNGEYFSKLDPSGKASILSDFETQFKSHLPKVFEDTMPGELSNVIAGRLANTFNLRGQNCTVDAACASSLAAMAEAVKGLRMHEFDMVVCGGSDFMMNPTAFVKFCKIGALSPDGSCPFDAKANGFVMGEGTGIFLLKRVSDARRDGDKIYAVIRAIGTSSDGKGKGITAPNPQGQILAIERAFQAAGYGPDTVQVVEAHGTSTSVGDRAEVESLLKIWKSGSLKQGSVGLGSVKSMIGHLKAAAGAASVIKMSLALKNKVIPPSINFVDPNPDIDFSKIPFRVITNPEEWPKGVNGNPRRANVSAFGFGGTNFHVALEEDAGNNGMPEDGKKYYAMNSGAPSGGDALAAAYVDQAASSSFDPRMNLSAPERKKIEAEAIVIGGDSVEEVLAAIEKLSSFIRSQRSGEGYGIRLKDVAAMTNPAGNGKDMVVAVSAESIDDCLAKLETAKGALSEPKKWLILANKGIFIGSDLRARRKDFGKLVLQFPGQGSQYANMLKDLYNKYQIVKDVFDEGDAIMKESIGETLTGIIFIPDDASEEIKIDAEKKMRRTEITQPSILMVDYALYKLLQTFGIHPDVVIGHSLGEYGALLASGVLSFRDALLSVAARGKEIASLKAEDVGKMASVATDYATVENVIKDIDGYVIPANKNCYAQTVIGGNTKPVEKAVEIFSKMGIEAREIPVSHAFHSSIVAPACEPYRRVLESLTINSPKIDIVANIDGEYYPKGNGAREKIIDMLVRHIANPVEFVKQIERLYQDGARRFVEVGPKKTLTSFVQNIAGKRPHFAVCTNHPKRGGIFSFNDALAAMAAAGFDLNWNGVNEAGKAYGSIDWRFREDVLGAAKPAAAPFAPARQEIPEVSDVVSATAWSAPALSGSFQDKQKEMMRNLLDDYSRRTEKLMKEELAKADYYKQMAENKNINFDRVMISGVAVGLPGTGYDVFEGGFERVLDGVNMIENLPAPEMEKILHKKIIRLVKNDGDPRFDEITDLSQVVKLAGQPGRFDFVGDYGADQDFADSLDITSKLAIAAGIRALRDAGIPLVQYYKDTTIGTLLPTHWGLPQELSEETGVIFTSAFPGYENFIEDISRSMAYKYGRKAKNELTDLYLSIIGRVKDEKMRGELSDWYTENYAQLKGRNEENLYQFNRKFLFRMLAMGHAQFAYFVKAKGPNVQINAACSSTASAVAMAEDWIRTGRAKRVVIVGADAITTEILSEWLLSAFFALGALTTEGDVRNAAIPFDKRRNGMIVGMGAVGIVVEAESELKKRGMEPIAELVATEWANSAFHVTRLDPPHIARVMEKLMKKVEKNLNIRRSDITDQIVFMSHETYTPARGGSAAAEIESLRTAFGDHYTDILVSNTKGLTGHTMGAGIEDAIIAKALQRGKIPPVANHKEHDPDLGNLNLCKGGMHPERRYGLRLSAGFGSQVSMSFMRLVSRDEKRIVDQQVYGQWLMDISGLKKAELEVVKNTLRIKDDIEQVRAGRAKTQNARAQAKAEPVRDSRPAIPASAPQKQMAISQPIPVTPAVAAISIDDMIRERIRTLVAEKTGYPEDMIEFDLDMESDLGIDTVKQAEMFGMIRDAFTIPKEEGLKIKDYPTLNHVIQFVKDRAPNLPKDMAPAPVMEAAAAPTPQTVAASPLTAAVAGSVEAMIRSRISALVAEKTGYPEDMIEFDLDMESDLGIDTVKQAEMFGMIRSSFDIPQEEGLKIKDYPTLNHVVQFVKDRAPGLARETSAAAAVPVTPAAAIPATDGMPVGAAAEAIRRRIREIVAEKTGYPEDMIEFDLDMESDLGIDTVKQAEMFGMIRDSFAIPREEGLKIKDYPTLNHVVQFVQDRAPGFSKEAPAAAQAVVPAAEVITQPQSVAVGDDADETIRMKIREIVAEKTGYPEDMIEFDLDMESDLGIDTVKQAEMFGMIRDSFAIPREEGLKIKDYPTLNHVVQFVQDRSTKLAAAPAPEPETAVLDKISATAIPESNIKRMVLEIVDASIDKQDKPAIDFDRMNILLTDDGRGIAKALAKLFKGHNATVEILDLDAVSTEEKLQAEIDRIKGGMAANGIIHLAAMAKIKPLQELTLEEWRSETFKRVKSMFLLARAFQKDLVENAKEGRAFLVGLTGMGGNFGVESYDLSDPISGGVTGLFKSFKKEMTDVLVKAMDVSLKQKPAAIAKTILHELQNGGKRVEIGYVGDRRVATQVAYKEFDLSAKPVNQVDEGSVFVVTGGGFGITAEIAKDLAKHLKIRPALISIESLPENIEELAAMSPAQWEAFKNGVIGKLKETHERVTPVMIQKETGKYAVALEIYRNLQEMKTLTGGEAEYYSCNVMDKNALAAVLEKIRERFGAINGVIHGAGLEQSKLLEDKKYEDFCRVFDVKADGAYNLVVLTSGDDVKYFVTFASISGRFGNIGQTDYSSANDLLNKLAQMLNHKAGDGKMKAVSMNWTGWKNIGMATRGSLVKIFEEGGVDMIPPEVGLPKVRYDMLYGGEAEVVVAGNVGEIDCDKIIVGDRNKEFAAIEERIRIHREQFPQIDHLVEFLPGKKIVVGRKLDTEVDVYLPDHAVDGVPYFPAVMGIETFSEAAKLLFPDKHIVNMKNVGFRYPIKLLKFKPVDIIVTLEKTGGQDEAVSVSARIESEFFTKDGKKLGDNRLHFVADIELADDAPEIPGLEDQSFFTKVMNALKDRNELQIPHTEIYKRLFHGPKFQVHGGVVSIENGSIIGKVSVNGNVLFSTVKKPKFIANPLFVEAALQNAGIYGMVKSSISALPDAIEEITFKPIPADGRELYAVATYVGKDDIRSTFQAHVMDKEGNVYSTLKNYKMITIGDLTDDEKF